MEQSVTCPAGKYLEKMKETCSTCTAGSYCPGGTFKVITGGGIYPCDTGYTSGAGASVCTPIEVTCEAGKYLEKNKTTCTTCTAGYYCTGGTFKVTEGGGRTQCASGYDSPAGATSKGQCCKEEETAEQYCPGQLIGNRCFSLTEGRGPACTSAGWTCTFGSSDHCYEGVATVSGLCSPSKEITNCRCRKEISTQVRIVKKISCQ